jgi:hypothetical protein
MQEDLYLQGTQTFHQIFACLLIHDDLATSTFVHDEIESHRCEKVVFHIIGAKCGIHKNSPIVIELQHGLNLHRCLDPYGEWDLNPIHFMCILEIKDIIRMRTNP